MASIHKRAGSPFWYSAFLGADGKRKFISTGTTNADDARTITKAWEKVAREGRQGQLTADRARSIIEQTVGRIMADSGQTLPGANAREYFTNWLKQQWSTWATGTAKNYKSKVTAFLKFLGPRADRSISTITADDIRSFLADVAKRSSARQANHYLTVMKIAFTRAIKTGLLDKSPAHMVDPMKAVHGERRAFTMDELRKVLSTANQDWRTMVMVGLYTGMRLRDCANLKWTNIDIQRQELTATTMKTGKTVIVPLAKPLMRHVENLPMGDDPRAFLCPSLAGRPPGTLSGQFHQILVDAGLAGSYNTHNGTRGDKRGQSDLCFHSLRHSITSLLKNAGVSDSIAMDIVGHDSADVSRNYTHIEMRSKRDAMDKMPDVTLKTQAFTNDQ